MASSFSAIKQDVLEREQKRLHYQSYILGLNAHQRHARLMQDYEHHYGHKVQLQPRTVKTDQDMLRESYRFIRSDNDDSMGSWEQRLAKRYYDKLFKEYCLADLSRYKENKVGLRWRTANELVAGKGQFICGNKKCEEREDLCSYEVNFAYKEAGEDKQALVKLRLCPECAKKLNYRKIKESERELRKIEKEKRKRKRFKDVGGTSGETEDDHNSCEKKARPSSNAKKDVEVNDGDKEGFDTYFEGMFL